MEAVSFFEISVNSNGIILRQKRLRLSHRWDNLSYNENSDVCDLPNVFRTHCDSMWQPETSVLARV
jgi:hypothetical protein